MNRVLAREAASSPELQMAPPGTVAEVMAAALRRHGVTEIFGQSIPAALFVVSHRYGIRQIGYRTENAGGAMADGYARISGKVGVVAAQNGPAATLLVAPLAEALKASVPLVAIVQDVPRSMTDRNAFQEYDHLKLFDGCAKWVRRIEDATRIDDYVDMAFTMAASGRAGPAVLIVPMDLFRMPAQSAAHRSGSAGTFPLDRLVPEPARIEEAARLLAAAKRPLIVAGGGVHLSGAAQVLQAFSAATNIPVATTNMGKGAVDETAPLTAGVFGNCMGPGTVGGQLRVLAEQADVVLLLGTRTNQNGTDTWKLYPPAARFIHIDIDPLEIGRNYEALRLAGDVAATLPLLQQALAGRDLSAIQARASEVKAMIAAARIEAERQRKDIPPGREGALRPEHLMRALDAMLGPDDIVVADASYSTNWVNVFLTARRAGARFLTPRGLAGLGWGFPMALGAKAARPGARVFVLEGDGGFGHCWSELETARRMNLPVVLMVLNNGILGYELHAEHVHYGVHSDACVFTHVDHAAIAAACGCHAESVRRNEDIVPALERATASGRMAVLDVMIDPDAYPPLSLFEGKQPAGDHFEGVGL
jgi:acetolactate synthase-1/2/3 large subunit